MCVVYMFLYFKRKEGNYADLPELLDPLSQAPARNPLLHIDNMVIRGTIASPTFRPVFSHQYQENFSRPKGGTGCVQIMFFR